VREGTPGKQARLLECDCAALVDVSDDSAVNTDLADGRTIQAGDLSQERRLSAPGSTQQRHNLARGDPQVDIAQNDATGLESLADTAQHDG